MCSLQASGLWAPQRTGQVLSPLTAAAAVEVAAAMTPIIQMRRQRSEGRGLSQPDRDVCMWPQVDFLF